MFHVGFIASLFEKSMDTEEVEEEDKRRMKKIKDFFFQMFNDYFLP